jgi:hypothetical protein
MAAVHSIHQRGHALSTVGAERGSNQRPATAKSTATVAKVPADAIALIVTDARTGAPRSFGRVEAGVAALDVYYQGRCSAVPNGTLVSSAGDRVVVRWVDRHGRVSAASKPAVIRTIKPR